MKRENYITIQGWMILDLKLKGNDLIIFALIYGFSQDGESSFNGSFDYIAKSTNLTRRSCINVIEKLIKKKLVKKIQKKNGNSYQVVKNFHHASEKISPVASEKISPNTNIDNNINNFCETSSQDDQKDFQPSPSLIRKISLVEKAAAASKSFLSDMETQNGIVDLVEDENITYPPNFNSQEAIKKLISPHENAKGKMVKPQRHIAVIGLYVLAKKMEVISDEQLASIIKRNVRAANLIKEYPFKRIIETMKFLVDKADFKWTLETVSKFIDEDLGKTNLNDLGKKSSGKVLGEDVMVKD